MFLTLTMTGADAPALGHLLRKHPDRVQTFTLPVGAATVFYPESTPERVTAALLLEVDPIGMVKRRLKSRDGLSLTDYVTDRPYAASSMLAVALGRVFNTALNGRSESYPELAAGPVPLEIRTPAVPARATSRHSGAEVVRRLFEPLGWNVTVTTRDFGPDGSWGPAPYVDLTLTGRVRLADALSQLYVLLPVLDNAKHYWVGSDEVAKLVRRGEGWLASHPERELIVRRYLKSRRDYVEDATARLQALDDAVDETEPHDPASGGEGAEAPTPLKLLRLQAVLDAVREVGARRVVDLGCGEGFYLRALLDDPAITEIVGIDVSPRVLEYAERRRGLDRRSERQRAKLSLWQSSATYRDDRLTGFDAILLVEVIEHLDPDRIDALEASVFGAARPAHVVLTTPNRDYNVVYGLPDGKWRHPDHRFEWTRAEFAAWARRVGVRFGYRVELRGVGAVDAELGAPTQLALFSRDDAPEPPGRGEGR
ncbi:3' terminal RNA ribose 2'-O-methyltransferase Hen1 [Micropruina sp.]|uniref:3' terminal RNA ribose 2'-O-methyltransferase Hen1 n=1 Tax=Micropruina sp. TaxID=2737536 RepID=UPI0039E3FDCF